MLDGVTGDVFKKNTLEYMHIRTCVHAARDTAFETCEDSDSSGPST